MWQDNALGWARDVMGAALNVSVAEGAARSSWGSARELPEGGARHPREADYSGRSREGPSGRVGGGARAAARLCNRGVFCSSAAAAQALSTQSECSRPFSLEVGGGGRARLGPGFRSWGRVGKPRIRMCEGRSRFGPFLGALPLASALSRRPARGPHTVGLSACWMHSPASGLELLSTRPKVRGGPEGEPRVSSAWSGVPLVCVPGGGHLALGAESDGAVDDALSLGRPEALGTPARGSIVF